MSFAGRLRSDCGGYLDAWLFFERGVSVVMFEVASSRRLSDICRSKYNNDGDCPEMKRLASNIQISPRVHEQRHNETVKT